MNRSVKGSHASSSRASKANLDISLLHFKIKMKFSSYHLGFDVIGVQPFVSIGKCFGHEYYCGLLHLTFMTFSYRTLWFVIV